MTSDNQQPQVEVIARYGKCPWCGSTDRMMGRLGKEMKEQGLIGEEVDVGLREDGGPIIIPTKIDQMLTQSIKPGMFALRDICVGCGREVTVKIERKLVMVGLQPIAGTVPGAGGAFTPPR